MTSTTANTTQYTVHSCDLPVCCPRPDMPIWNAHPRVYLPLEDTGHAICPYCGTEFFLSDEAVNTNHD